jgi:hypothetical protein
LPKPKVQPKAIEAKPLPRPIEPKTKVNPKPLPQPKKEVVVPKAYNEPVVKKPVVEDKTFKVQIAAMKKAELFNDEKVAQIWKIDQVKHGDFTLFIMDGIKTLQQAKDLKAKVKTAGYTDAKVVVKDGDKFRVVD